MISNSKFFNSINNSLNIYLNRILSNNNGYIKIESDDLELSGNLIINGDINLKGNNFGISLNSDQIEEASSNIYFTENRSRSSISVVNTYNNRHDSLQYDTLNGVLKYTGIDLSKVQTPIVPGYGIEMNNDIISVIDSCLNLYNSVNILDDSVNIIIDRVNIIDTSINNIMDVTISDITLNQEITDNSVNIIIDRVNNIDTSINNIIDNTISDITLNQEITDNSVNIITDRVNNIDTSINDIINITISDITLNQEITDNSVNQTINRVNNIDISINNILENQNISDNSINDINNFVDNIVDITIRDISLHQILADNSINTLSDKIDDIETNIDVIIDNAITDISSTLVVIDNSINNLDNKIDIVVNKTISDLSYVLYNDINNIYNQTAIIKSDIIVSQSNHEYNSKRIDILYDDIDDFKITYYSDEKIKHDKKPIKNALNTISKLQPYTYSLDLNLLINNNNTNNNNNKKQYIIKQNGYMAQDILKIPELSHSVTKPNNDTQLYKLNYQNIFVYQTQAIKELHEIIKRQNAKIDIILKILKKYENAT